MVITIVPCKECHEHPCACEEEEIKMEIKCNCGKTLFIIDTHYTNWGDKHNILVEEHECLIPSWTFKHCSDYHDVEEYYEDEGDVDDKT